MKTCLVFAFVTSLCVAAQEMEIDTVNFGARPHGSLADRAESSAERRDYIALQKARTAEERRAMADRFLARYAASWLLAGVYQSAASASLELNDQDRALEEGRASLRLIPENAPLLVVLAQVEIGMGRNAAAVRDANDALLWLNLLAPPGGVKESEWKKTRGALENTARGVIERARGRQPWLDRPHAASAKGLKFAGSEACKTCHAAVYESWRKTGMSAMLRPVPEARVLADFSKTVEFRDPRGEVAIRVGGGDHPSFEFPRADGQAAKRFRVDYVIGSKWQQAYAAKVSDGRLFVLPIQYNALQGKWLNYWATIDSPASERADIATFPRLSGATSYQRNCAVCHTSQLGLARLDDQTMQKAAFREPGINCEMCHGPSALHAAAPQDATPPLGFSQMDHVEATLVCEQCHRQSAVRNLGSNGEMNYSHEPPYYERLLSQPPAEFGARAFYRDGRYRETTFIGESFLRSACFRRGSAQCASCHDPHPPDAAANPTSLKFRDDPDRMCVQCHTAVGAQGTAHTHHPPASPGARCAACHMPPIMNSLLFQAASHQLDDIPRADFTIRFGGKDSPNACLLCHRDKESQWLTEQLQNWKTAPSRSAGDLVCP
jgi:predicted CXXCH cytochrome family protein